MGRVDVCGSRRVRLCARGCRFRARRCADGRCSTRPAARAQSQAVAAARAGADVSFTGARGRDGFGDTLGASPCDATGSTWPGWSQSTTQPASALILVEEAGGENQIVLICRQRMTACAVRPDVSVWVTQAEIPVDAVVTTLETARASGATALVNPAPAGGCRPMLVARFDIAVVDETELKITRRTSRPGHGGDPGRGRRAAAARRARMLPAMPAQVFFGRGQWRRAWPKEMSVEARTGLLFGDGGGVGGRRVARVLAGDARTGIGSTRGWPLPDEPTPDPDPRS